MLVRFPALIVYVGAGALVGTLIGAMDCRVPAHSRVGVARIDNSYVRPDDRLWAFGDLRAGRWWTAWSAATHRAAASMPPRKLRA